MSSQDLLLQDTAHRARALDLRSFIVEAPAGAGKTELLTQRYLRLLALVREPEEIIAITFTNKAAAEMRARVLQSLQDAAEAAPVDKPHKAVTRRLALEALARSSQQGWQLLTQPARLRINTIDAFCSLLARQMPLMSRFGGQPAVSDDASPHYREAARRALAMLEEQGGEGVIAGALRYFDNHLPRLTELLAEMLAKRDQWLGLSARHSALEEAEAALQHLIMHDLARATSALTPDIQARLMPHARFAAAHLPCGHPIALLADWETPLPLTPQALPRWRALCELLLTGSGEARKSLDKRQGFPATPEGNPHKAALLEMLAELPDPRALARARALPNGQSDAAERAILLHLEALLHLAVAHLLLVFQEAGEVDFVEVATRALRALQDENGPTDLALSLDYRIQHLLVDEFQDTSPTQVELLRRLTQGWQAEDGRTLFCVGDPMQSIYRFRKADVGLFLQAAVTGIGDLPLERLHLTRNNRSCPAIVQWVNAAFGRVFPEQDSITRGAIRYRPFVATRAAAAGAGVEVHALVTARAGELAAAVEARHVAALIARERAASPGTTLAVLVRARSHLEALVAEIRRNHPELRFQAVEVEALSGRQSVQDVTTLTRALFHRADRVHWLALLRAPWCGLTLRDLHVLAADDPHATLWTLMQEEDRLARLSDDGRARLLHVREILAEAFLHQGRQRPRRWVEGVWLRLGGAQCLWEPGDARDVQAMFDLIERLDCGPGFEPELLEQAMAELYAAPDLNADAGVQFMTIHKSKGLEFDTVILPGLHRPPRHADAPLVLWEEVAIENDAPRLIAAPLAPKHRRAEEATAYDYLRSLEDERAANEAARVLYVAATRAERRLHLVGVLSPDAKGELKPAPRCFLELLWESLSPDFLAAEPLPEADSAAVPEADFAPKLIRLPHLAAPTRLEAGSALALAETPAHDVRSAAAATLEAHCGTLAHLYLELIAQDGLAQWPLARLGEVKSAMQAWLGAQGHQAREAESGAKRVAAALAATLASTDGQWVLRDRPGAASELVITAFDGLRTMTHVVDRTFVEEGARWVIDYKSARLQAHLPQQQARYRPQLARYAALFREEGLPIKMAVFLIASGRLCVLD